ncbi:MAG: FeoB-associated Cys-rich membrane protein [Oscillospiraceae bacterium]|nr:FeoB-associated Cys-rich membrane protein [Oscillospiraceae bacterium]
MTWFAENFGTILVLAVIAAIVALIVRRLVKQKRAGKSSCSCGCENCAMRGRCHSEN